MNSKESQTTGVVTVTKTNAADLSTSLTIADLEKAVGEINYTPIEWINGGGAPWAPLTQPYTTIPKYKEDKSYENYFFI